MVLDYQHGYDDAKSEPCRQCKVLKKIITAYCTEMIEFLEGIDGVVSVDHTTKIDAGDKIKALKKIREHAEYGG